MNLTKSQLGLINALMSRIETTDEWEGIQANDPVIKQEFSRLEEIIENLLPKAQEQDTLWPQIYEYVNALSSAAILYGMWVSETLHTVTEDPSLLSEYVRDRMGDANGK